MQLGLFLDLRNPAPWRRDWAEHYARTLDLVVDAEAEGLDSVWTTEHHQFDDGYLPQPLTMLAALAARTSRLRLGTAVLLAGLRHPQHVAEEAALVDLLSNGRLELGIGAGYSVTEFTAFGADIRRRMGLADAAVVEIRRLWRGVVTPPPVQDPVPVWLGYTGPQGARRAGRLGTGLMTLQTERLAPYLAGLEEAGHDPATARMAGLVDLVVADDPDEAAHRLLPHVAHQQNTYSRTRAEMTGRPPSSELTVEGLRERYGKTGLVGNLAVTDPDGAVRLIREKVADVPAAHVYFWASVAGMPDDLVDTHVELLLTRVKPALDRRS